MGASPAIKSRPSFHGDAEGVELLHTTPPPNELRMGLPLEYTDDDDDDGSDDMIGGGCDGLYTDAVADAMVADSTQHIQPFGSRGSRGVCLTPDHYLMTAADADLTA